MLMSAASRPAVNESVSSAVASAPTPVSAIGSGVAGGRASSSSSSAQPGMMTARCFPRFRFAKLLPFLPAPPLPAPPLPAPPFFGGALPPEPSPGANAAAVISAAMACAAARSNSSLLSGRTRTLGSSAASAAAHRGRISAQSSTSSVGSRSKAFIFGPLAVCSDPGIPKVSSTPAQPSSACFFNRALTFSRVSAASALSDALSYALSSRCEWNASSVAAFSWFKLMCSMSGAAMW